MLKNKVETYIESLGLDTFGFIPCRSLTELETFYNKRQELNLTNEFESGSLEDRLNPNHYMEDGKTIISIAFPYYHKDETSDLDNGFSVYTKRLDYHRVVKSYLNKIASYIESLGGKAITFVDSNTLPERYIAYLSGVGFIGKNNMIITKKYGSYVFLGEIITDLNISCEDSRIYEDLSKFKECGECEICLNECPSKSINKNRCNPNICLSYLTQKKDLETKEINLLKGNIFGCDFCQLKCPYNEGIETNVLEDFKTLSFMNDNPLVYASMNNKYFKENINTTSCGWRGKNVIKRNALIRLHKEGISLEDFKGDSPYINEYIEKLSE